MSVSRLGGYKAMIRPILLASALIGLSVPALITSAEAQRRQVIGDAPGGYKGGGPQRPAQETAVPPDGQTQTNQNQPANQNQGPSDTSVERLLDGSLGDPAKLAEAQRKSEEQPPASTDPSRLSTFYFERGLARMVIGQYTNAIADFRQAAEQAEQGRNLEAGYIWTELAIAYKMAARPASAFLAGQKAIETARSPTPPRLSVLNAHLVTYASAIGELAVAEKALAAVKDAAASPRQGGGQGQVVIQMSLLRAEADLLEARGKYTEAEPLRRQAIGMTMRFPHLKGMPEISRLMALSQNLMMQGRMGDAEVVTRRALISVQQQFGQNSFYVAHVLQRLANILIEQGRLADAEALANRSQQIAQSNSTQSTGGLFANLYAAQGRWREAAERYDAVRKLRSAEDFEAFASNNPNYALVMVKAGRAAEVLRRLEHLLDTNRQLLGDKHAETAETRGLLAMALVEAGQTDRALSEFAAAIPILTQASRAAESDDGQSARDMRQRAIIEAYIDLLMRRHGAGQPLPSGIDAVAESFRLAEAARGRDVQRALAASATRAAAGNPALADLVRNLQDAEKQIAALNAALANAISARADGQNPNTTADLRRRIDGLRDMRGGLAARLEREFPDFAALLNPKPADVAAMRKALRPGETLVSFYVGDKATYIWAIGSNGSTSFHMSPLGRIELASLVSKLRTSLEPNADSVAGIPAFDTAIAHRLYAELLAPLGAPVSTAQHLLTVPHGPLGQLPLGLLITEATPMPSSSPGNQAFTGYRGLPWLIRKMAVTQLPAAASLGTLRALPPGAPDRQAFIGYGDPWFNNQQASEAASSQLAMRGAKLKLRSAPSNVKATDANAVSLNAGISLKDLPRLPETADEVRNIAGVLLADAGSGSRLGKQASRSAVKAADLSHQRVIMFATHGLIPGELEGLDQPALALSAPDVTGQPDDGLLTAADILGLKLNADWVVLSACNTAAGSGAGSEAISGLGRAFFYAGTRALLVSNWPVETTSAAALTTELFRRQAGEPGLSRAEALRQAMLNLIDKGGNADFSYAHPIFWAPFSLVGDGA
ncbi:CHAT domain-containing protein [Ferrovibrio sp.]|uniref:CHAT domain-containing tetratricopeptide repeat protein n=1 Tax=Ferrovibrio sp. TaxID=1917215 RepID=UPI0025C197BE|nr:CHAT domain-containing protein [Ferrovibrio sp.]MBX3454882.1 CHAT domain-containing protein [Ferrovibrio sp.]